GMGIGTAMMKKMLAILKEVGYEKASLSVQRKNYAVKMYQKVGFKIAEERGDEYIMVNYLQ
ncbi:MAG: GNAT family N-acetyltransferase, partial [Lachnospiraceae bacterium]